MNIVKEWVKLDNEIRVLQKEMADRKKLKKTINEKLMEVMRTNEINGFDLNDGQIVYSRKTVKKPMTQKILLDVLSKYFNNDYIKATELNSFINENRLTVTRESITRSVNSNK